MLDLQPPRHTSTLRIPAEELRHSMRCAGSAQIDEPDVDRSIVGQRARDPLANRLGVDNRYRRAGLERSRRVNQSGDLPVGGERKLDLRAWADERVANS